MNSVELWVPGIPAPGGSKRAFLNRHTGRVMVLEDCSRTKGWRNAVAWAAAEAIKEPMAGPLELRIDFILPRPKGHFGSGKNWDRLKASAPPYPDKKPDTTKLIRSTEDSLKGIAWNDDSQIVIQFARKVYGPKPGAIIKIGRVNGRDGERTLFS